MGWQEYLSNLLFGGRYIRRRRVTLVEDGIKTSAGDGRLYRALTLSNELRVLLISDSTTEKAAAALDVHVGHMSDPACLPGLAHLCEHMLFMGNRKMQMADEYKQFLRLHGGSSNACTSMEHTNYHMDVTAAHLAPALQRFSHFIRHPKFDPHVIEREVSIVNAENMKNLSSDQWRLFQLNKSTANPDHPYSKFGTGSIETLLTVPKNERINVYKMLVNFHRKYYSSNIMSLAVLGRETLDELETMVEGLFGDVANRLVKLPQWPTNPYGPNELKVQLNVVPLKTMQNMLLTWPIEDLVPLYKKKPGHYLGYVLSFQGPGSLFSLLKSRGWVNQLVASNKMGARGFMFFCISMDLTDKGFSSTNAIIHLVFEYIMMLKQRGISEAMYRECSTLKSLRFRFKEKENPRDYVSDCAELLHMFPYTDVLEGPWLMSDYDQGCIRSLVDSITPETLRVVVRSKKFSGETDMREKWYGTEYSVIPIPEETLNDWRQATCKDFLHLPPTNQFIPTQLQLVARDPQKTSSPLMILNSDLGRLWYCQDDRFLIPKTSVTFLLKRGWLLRSPLEAALIGLLVGVLRSCLNDIIPPSPVPADSVTIPRAYLSAEQLSEQELSVDLLIDRLRPISQPAEWAGLFCDLFSTPSGITVALHGYSDTLGMLLKIVMEALVSCNQPVQDSLTSEELSISPADRFTAVKSNYIERLTNFNSEQPHRQAEQHISWVSGEGTWTKSELLEQTHGLSWSMLQDFLSEFFSQLHVEMLVYGNVTRSDALQYMKMVTESLCHVTPLSQEHRRYRLRELKLPKGVSVYSHRIPSNPAPQGCSSSSVALYWQCGQQTSVTNVLLELLSDVISQRAYDVIRNDLQLGYVVLCTIRRSRGVQGLRLVVQSHLPTCQLQDTVLMFIDELREWLENISDDAFQKQKAVLQQQRLEKPKRIGEQNARYWTEISSNLYQFDRAEVEVRHLQTITKRNLIQFYEDYFHSTGAHRSVLSVQVGTSPSVPSDMSKQCTVIGDLAVFKTSLDAHPPPLPAVNLDVNTVAVVPDRTSAAGKANISPLSDETAR